MRFTQAVVAAMLLTIGVVGVVAVAAELAEEKAKQRAIQSETARLVRRMETMIRVLQYIRLQKSAEKKLLDQVHGMLDGLSREQMEDVIAALEKANTLK